MRGQTKKNIIYNMTYQLLVMILPFITAPYISRVFGTYGVGMHTYTYNIAHYFVLFSMMGLANYGNRSIAQVRDDKEKLDKTFSEIYSMQIFFSLLSLSVYIVFQLVFGAKYRILFMIQSLYVLSTLFDVTWFFYGIEEFKTIVFRNSVIKIGTALSIFVFVKKPDDIWIYSLIRALGFLLSSAYIILIIKKYTVFNFTKNFKHHIKPNIVLFIPVIAVSLYRTMDKIMIGSIEGMSDTGLYENADSLVTLPLTLITSIGTVMMPKMANMYSKGDSEKSKSFIRDSMQFILMLSIAMMFGIASISNRFVPFYYGNEFKGAAFLVLCLSPVLLFSSLANVIRTQFLIPKGKDKSYIVSVISGAILNLIINACLIPVLGAFGAVLGTLAAEFSVMTIQCVAVRKDLDIKLYFKDIWEALVAGIIMFFSVVFIEKISSFSIIGILEQIFVGVVTYSISIIILYGIFDRDRLKYLFKIIKK